MKVKPLFIFSLLIFLVHYSCEKSPGDCFTSTGEIVSETRTITAFNSILMQDNIDVELIASNTPLIELTAGKNLLQNISIDVIDSQLVIKNNNQCNFVRSFEKPITAKVYFSRLDSIEYRSVGNLICRDEINNPDTFKIDVFEGAGNISLLLNNYVTQLNFHYGTANLKAEGYSQLTYFYQVSYGPIDARNLTSVFAYLENNSTNNTWVRSNTVLEATINSIGSVYYYGDPQISLTGGGSGGLIRAGD